ncbi:MAG TPA: hypothetical protein VKB31_07660 [Trueperaceae bacterium]|nr:hypothetical protein [Trueperaceae bacterium]
MAWTFLAALLLGLPGLAAAQNSPTVTLNSNLMRVGDRVSLDASDLRPNSGYTVTLTAPDGSAQTSKVTADGSGKVHFEHVLSQPGRWTVRLAGPGIDAPLDVQVSADQSGPGRSPGAPGGGSSNGSTSNGTTSNGGGAGSGGSAPSGQAPGANGQPPGSGSQAPSGNGQAPSAPSAGPLQLSIVQNAVVASSGGQEQWRLDFPPDSGDTAGTAQLDGTVYVGHGNSLLAIDAGSGRVTDRYALPAQVVDVAASTGGVTATVQFKEGSQQKLDVTSSGVQGTVRFDADPAMFAWLRNEAKVSDPAARLKQDPTNPWLYVAVARQATDAQTTADDYRMALAHARTFYDRAQLARVLYAADQPDLAKQAIDGALKDYWDRGYTADLLTDPSLREAYGFPQGALEQAISGGDMQAAAFWAPWAYRMSTPAVPSTQAALQDYSSALRSAGQKQEASLWRARAHEGSGFRLQRALRRAALALGRAGWYGVAALLVAMVFLHLTLIAKYWRPQSLALRQRRESGRSTGRVPRLFALRYYTITEKFVLVLMFAAVLALASLSAWATRGDQLPTAWRSGTLASVPARDALPKALVSGQDADFVRGYAAQVAGDDQAASQAYQAAGAFPQALNNLGVLRKDDALYQQALDAGADLPEALFNLGRTTDPSRLHAAYSPNTPLLAVPNDTLLRSAVAGNFQHALASAFTDPWLALTAFNPLAIPAWLWYVLVVLFLAWTAVTVISLVVPRAGLARNAPRTGVYHLLALLIPGSGLADELWGVLLLVPWAIFGLDTLLHFLPLGAPAGISLTTDYVVLGFIYALNIVAFIVELGSYRRRMAELKRSHPDTARAYGMEAGWKPEEWPQ